MLKLVKMRANISNTKIDFVVFVDPRERHKVNRSINIKSKTDYIINMA